MKSKKRYAGYVQIYSAPNYEDNREARCLCDFLKNNGVRSRLGHSCYVGHSAIEVYSEDIIKASKTLRTKYDYRDEGKFVARAAREALKDFRSRTWMYT